MSDSIKLILNIDHKKSEKDLIWGDAQIYIGDQELISADGLITWTWVDLLEWLADNWHSLIHEQSYPFGISASSFLDFMEKLKSRWETMDDASVDEEEGIAYPFIDRHDLDHAFKGMYIPSVFIIRREDNMEISFYETNKIVYIPINKAIADLEFIGNYLASLISGPYSSRGVMAYDKWVNRINE